jgi:hypothetical protein
MVKGGSVCYASVFWCGRRISSIKSMEWYIVHHPVGLLYMVFFKLFQREPHNIAQIDNVL